MTGSNIDFTERLYLEKGNTDIYVDSNNLAPHHIEGLRFLYRQYKKRKPGVILNYPPRCGTSMQVVLFFSAIAKLLKYPILILYKNEYDGQKWQRLISKYMYQVPDTTVSVSATDSKHDRKRKRRYRKKSVVIKDIADVSSYCSRCWSMVAVKSNEVDSNFVKLKLNVAFKIWITDIDIKTDHRTLRLIHNWIYPRSDLNMNEVLESHKISDYPTKQLLLHAFVEDVMITRVDVAPFSGIKRKYETTISPTVKMPREIEKSSRIKKTEFPYEDLAVPSTSKFGIEKDALTAVDQSNSSEDSASGRDTTKGEDNEESNSGMLDVESFIRDNDPIEASSNLSMAQTLDTSSQSSGDCSQKDDSILLDNAEDNLGDVSQSSDNNNQMADDENSIVDTGANNEVQIKNEFNVTDMEPIYNEIRGVEQPENYCNIKICEVTSLANSEHESRFGSDFGNEHDGTKMKIDKNDTRNELDRSIGEFNIETGEKIEMNRKEPDSFYKRMKEMEENALKKYKGSFLDKMF